MRLVRNVSTRETKSTTDPTAENKPVQVTSGWERADSVAHGVGKVVNGTSWLLTKAWGVILMIFGIVGPTLGGAGIWAGLVVVAYGIYLLAPGRKFVVW